ncbi:hypothetical protein ACFFRR_011129 [Megaselia abdita]
MKTCIILSAILMVTSASVMILESRIIGGRKASPGEFPYQAFLAITYPHGQSWCGASIIDANWVLTATHCTASALQIDVVAGSLDIEDFDSTVQRIPASQIINHDQYNPVNLNNDITLIRLQWPLKLNNFVYPIKLVARNDFGRSYEEQRRVVASGWGKMSEYGGYPDELRFVKMHIENIEKCKDHYSTDVINEGVFCTNTDDGYSTTCDGDSGGPLASTDSGRLIGITSFVSGGGCNTGAPGGFTKIEYHLDWIKYHTGLDV